MKKVIALLGLAALTLALTAVGMASAVKSSALSAALSAGQEVPKVAVKAPNARGTFTGSLAANGTLSWRLTFRGLTGRADAAHIHLGKAGKAGPVAAALCGPCRSGQLGRVKVNAAQARAIRTKGAYVNVHTKKNPNGEIRGQIALR